MVVDPAKAIDENFRAVLCDTKDGKNVINEVPMLAPKWGLRLNAPGTVSVDIPIKAREVRNMDLRNATTTIMRSLGISYDEVMLECGPILHRSYDAQSERLTLTAAGIWSVLDRRKILNAATMATGANAQRESVVIGPVALHSIARELVRLSMINPAAGGTASQLNILLPALAAGGHTRTYEGYDLRYTGTAIKELTEVSGGPDVRFRPQYDPAEPTRVQWLMETGTEAQPLLKQNGPPWRFDGTAKRSPVVGFGGSEDATKVAARAWRPGAGSERDMKIGVMTDTTMADLGMPWTEIDTASKQEGDVAVLNAQAAFDLQGSIGPSGTISVTVRADGYPKLGTYWPGDYAAIIVPDGNPIFSPGARATRIMAIDGDESNNVKLTLAPFLNSWQGSPAAAGHTTTNGVGDIFLGTGANLGPTLQF